MADELTKLQTKIDELEKAVQKLQNIAWVIAAVAAVFGVGGAFGITAFNSAKGELAQLQGNISKIDSTVADSMSVRGREAAARLNQSADNLLKRFALWGPATPLSESQKDVVFGGQSGLSDVQYCPEGQYVTGMQVIDQDGGGYCVSCINGVRFICRPLNR